MTTIDLNHEIICVNPTDNLTLYDKNHITSRIEKFLFAICSLDSSDLPVPLSRIEELYNCLVTGDTPPTFEPSSRAEKFLMTCLGVYDINKLPEPLSRSEVLLKKIATGDSNLDDVDNLQSKYEFLLAYIIQNGGIDSDISYMKYTLTEKETTLYNTKERLVKSAILKGNTLVNLVNFENNLFRTTGTVTERQGNKVTFTTSTTGKFNLGCQLPTLKANTKYLLKIKATSSLSANVTFHLLNVTSNKYIIDNTTISNTVYSFTTNDVVDNIRLGFYGGTSVGDDTIVGEAVVVEYQEGMENWDIPYFEGMASVKMPVLTTIGKNLFHIDGKEVSSTSNLHQIQNDEVIMENTTYGYYNCLIKYFNLQPNGIYTISYDSEILSGTPYEVVLVQDDQGNTLSNYNKGTFTAPLNGKVQVRFYSGSENKMGKIRYYNIQIEEYSTATSYEPYKSNILTVNEEVELGKVNNVEDELNLLTGELTQRTHEITLDVTNVQVLEGDSSDRFEVTSTVFPLNNQYITRDYSGVINWGLRVVNNFNFNSTNTICYHANAHKFFIRFEKGMYTAESLKQKLNENPLTIRYTLDTPIVKTVDLSIVNQDGNDTKLSTFDDITYITLSSEGLIPEAELEVATKNEEVLNTLSLEMDDISAAQTTLEETTNTQNENVDATMIATTEIYEGLL